MGVKSEVGLTNDRDLTELVLKKHVFYTSTIPEVTWYKALYNILFIGKQNYFHKTIRNLKHKYTLEEEKKKKKKKKKNKFQRNQ